MTCPSCREPLNYPSGDGCAAMTKHKDIVAADRIEELERGMDALQDRLDAANKARADAMSLAIKKQDKLTKAVEALRETDQAIMLHTDETSWRVWGEVAVSNIRAALAELEGKK